MINVESEKCQQEGCNKRPYFNLPTETKGIFCSDHKKEGMIRFLVNEMKHKRILFPAETPEVKRLKDELRNFGIKMRAGVERMESLAGHDDLVISLALTNQATQQFGGASGFAITQD